MLLNYIIPDIIQKILPSHLCPSTLTPPSFFNCQFSETWRRYYFKICSQSFLWLLCKTPINKKERKKRYRRISCFVTEIECWIVDGIDT